MARILIAWEFGSGFGHAAMLLPLAETLRDAGHEVVLALRDPASAAAESRRLGMHVTLAPALKLRKLPGAVVLHTLADILFHAGFAEPDALSGAARAWQAVLAETSPELVINEFAPTLAIATLGVVPTLTLGTGYSVPPPGMALPNLRFWQRERPAASAQSEAAVLGAVQAVRTLLKLPPLRFFSDLFGGEGQFVCTYPLLDCYRECRAKPACGPLAATCTRMMAGSKNPARCVRSRT